MISREKFNITLLILVGIVLLLIFFAANYLINRIEEGSGNLIVQKKDFLESEIKIGNIHDFRNNFKQYRQNLEKIDSFFVNAAEPVEFIEFLEKEASASRLSIKIIPSANLEFNLSLEGSFPDFARFLERLEYGRYLVKPLNLNIMKNADKEKKDAVSAVLLIKAYAND